jgi:hypothetical protein
MVTNYKEWGKQITPTENFQTLAELSRLRRIAPASTTLSPDDSSRYCYNDYYC